LRGRFLVRLPHSLEAEADEPEGARLYVARSVPFDPPTRGKIAGEVINHHGDEVLNTYVQESAYLGVHF
jgi:hypothetical protein